MTAYDLVTARLDGLRAYHLPAAGIARAARCYCPSHQPPPHPHGRGRTLSIAETDDGRVLAHCHAGCAAADVLAALALRDLYPAVDTDCGERRDGPRYSGPSVWASAAAAADTLAEVAGKMLASPGDPQAFGAVWSAVEQFRRAARAAMRTVRATGGGR